MNHKKMNFNENISVMKAHTSSKQIVVLLFKCNNENNICTFLKNTFIILL